jgi:5-formyltetrahydrofolate cyclo-ligase
MPDKSAVRELLKARIRALDPQDRSTASAAITRHVLALPEYKQARTVMLFVSMTSEADTSAIASDAWQNGKRVLVPVAKMQDHSMHAVEIRSLAEAKRRTSVGVMEPEPGTPADLGEINLVLVPGLGFGPTGERIGRGAGFYDRFLADPRMQAITCGLGFEVQVIEGIPMSPRDMTVDMLVTEAQVRRFRLTNPYVA